MSYLKVNVDEHNKRFVEELLTKLGLEVEEEKTSVNTEKKPPKVSPTFLFGKWKNTSLNPVTFRKELWRNN